MISVLLVTFICTSIVCWVMVSNSAIAVSNFSDEAVRFANAKLNTMFVFRDTRQIIAIYVLFVILLPAILYFLELSPVIIGIFIAAILWLPKWVFRFLAVRRKSAISTALPDCLLQICGAMRAGATFSSAIHSMVEEQSGPISQEFTLLLREQRMGTPLDEALENLGERVQSEEMDLVISATLISQEIGGNLAEILARLAETLRRKMEMEGKVNALTSQGVLQGYVVTALPFLIMVALTVVESEAMKPLFNSVLGWLFLLLIAVLQLLGGLSIRKIVAIDI